MFTLWDFLGFLIVGETLIEEYFRMRNYFNEKLEAKDGY